MKIRALFIAALLLLSESLLAHGGGEDFFRSIGKIYVVFAVILSIFAGIFVFLLWLERRLARIEKQIHQS